jgi:hypothetical protein
MDKALQNRETIKSIRQRLLSGQISYEQARVEALPLIDDINKQSAILAKKHGVKAGKINFTAMMR